MHSNLRIINQKIVQRTMSSMDDWLTGTEKYDVRKDFPSARRKAGMLIE